MADYLAQEAGGGHFTLEDGSGALLLEVQSVPTTGDYLVQEVDGVGRFTLEDGSGFILLESGVPPAPPEPTGGGAISVRRRLRGRVGRIVDADEEDLIALTLALRTIRRRTFNRDDQR